MNNFKNNELHSLTNFNSANIFLCLPPDSKFVNVKKALCRFRCFCSFCHMPIASTPRRTTHRNTSEAALPFHTCEILASTFQPDRGRLEVRRGEEHSVRHGHRVHGAGLQLRPCGGARPRHWVTQWVAGSFVWDAQQSSEMNAFGGGRGVIFFEDPRP